MSFVNIEEYGEYKLPTAGNATKYMICKNIDSYKPYDIGNVSETINSLCNEIKEDKQCDEANEKVKTLGTEWGTNFIAIDGNDIGIVIPDEFNTQFESIYSHINEQAERCEKIVSDISSRLEDVNSYYNKLKTNLDEYNKLLSDKTNYENEVARYANLISNETSKEETNSSNLSNLYSSKNECELKLGNINAELGKYTIISEPDGQWIVG